MNDLRFIMLSFSLLFHLYIVKVLFFALLSVFFDPLFIPYGLFLGFSFNFLSPFFFLHLFKFLFFLLFETYLFKLHLSHLFFPIQFLFSFFLFLLLFPQLIFIHLSNFPYVFFLFIPFFFFSLFLCLYLFLQFFLHLLLVFFLSILGIFKFLLIWIDIIHDYLVPIVIVLNYWLLHDLRSNILHYWRSWSLWLTYWVSPLSIKIRSIDRIFGISRWFTYINVVYTIIIIPIYTTMSTMATHYTTVEATLNTELVGYFLI